MKQIFPEKELRGLCPNFHIHVFWAIYIFPQSVCLFCCRKYVESCGKALKDTWGRAINFLGLHK
jgi:hypothetical protein